MGISKLRGVLEHTRIGPDVFSELHEKLMNHDKLILDMSVIIWAYVEQDLDRSVLMNKLRKLKSMYSEIICVFDGRAPVQKLKEQLQRRVYNDRKSDVFGGQVPRFDFFNQEYQEFISSISKDLDSEDFIVISSDIDGEADHKIYQYLAIDEPSPVIVVSNDWDLFVRAVCFGVTNPNLSILYSSPAGLYDPDRILDPIRWLQSVMVLGSDYYPGIGNYKLFKHLFERFNNDVIWLEQHHGRIEINRPKFAQWLTDNVPNFDSTHEYIKRNFNNVIDRKEITESNYENTFSSDETCTGVCVFS